jgi:capsular polysaccharide biosynthesis protein
MELRHYWRILWRRRLLLAVVLTVGLVASVYSYLSAPRLYSATAKVVIHQIPSPVSSLYYDYDRYYNWLASEYLIDDITQIVRGNVFLSDVVKQPWAQQLGLSPDALAGAVAVERTHRILTISATWNDAAVAVQLANGIADNLAANRMKYFGRSGTDDAAVAVVQRAEGASENALRKVLELAIKVVGVVVLGVGVAMLADYLDDSFKTAADVEGALGLRVLSQVPPDRRWPR